MNRAPHMFVAALVAAALLLPLAGCGADDDKEPAATASTTLDPERAGFAKEVTPICERLQQDLQGISAAFPEGTEPTAAQFKAGLQQASTLYLAGIEEIRNVTPPDALTERVDTWLVALTKAAERLPTLTKADARKGVDAFVGSDPLARDLGLNNCTSTGE